MENKSNSKKDWKVINMDCNNCGGKMVKLKYLKHSDLKNYLIHEYKPSLIENYNEWLKSLNENDLVVTLFKREQYNGIKEKYYLRLVEKKTKNGLKLKRLSKIFKFDSGELIYGEKENTFSIITTYKIYPITEEVDILIRDYCSNTEIFDIDNLNKIITKSIL
ncbi:MAG: hypothetical protein ABF289_08935 [Clostridiales bacterium]